jgi:hypothetical protein
VADVPRIGIDPAPKKGLAIFDPQPPAGAKRFRHITAKNARVWLATERESRGPLVGWDAPLYGAFGGEYVARPIEKLWRKFEKEFGSAVSVLGFSGCPHWTISLDVLGRPLPDRLATSAPRLPLRFPGDEIGPGVVETHPAVALAMVWPEGEKLPVYKASKKNPKKDARKAVRAIQDFLGNNAKRLFGVGWVNLPTNKADVEYDPSEKSALTDDDWLDAEVSYLCVEAMCRGHATLLGDRVNGGFVVPKTAKADRCQERYVEEYGASP